MALTLEIWSHEEWFSVYGRKKASSIKYLIHLIQVDGDGVMGVQHVISAGCLIMLERTSIMMNAEDWRECGMSRGTDYGKQKQLSGSCQFNNNEAVNAQVTISTTTEFVKACRHWIIHQCDWRFCCKLMILQWNEGATFNTVMTCHLNVMTNTLDALGIIFRVNQQWWTPSVTRIHQLTSITNYCYTDTIVHSSLLCMLQQLKQKTIQKLL